MTAIDEAFATLRALAAEAGEGLGVVVDRPDHFELDAAAPDAKGRSRFFVSLRRGRAYASLHVMALYCGPSLLAEVTPALRKRMQGKSCFNFKATPEAAIRTDLAGLLVKARAAMRGP